MKSKDSSTENLILFWKGIEQLIMSYDDLVASILSINRINSEMQSILQEVLSASIKQTIMIRLKLNRSILKKLSKVKIKCKKLLDRYSFFENQVQDYNFNNKM